VRSIRTAGMRMTLGIIPGLLIANFAGAADLASPSMAAGPGGVLQMVLGLGLVLAAVALSAWLLRRFSGKSPAARGALKIIAGAAVGTRERLVLVEIGDTWLVVGVAPGRISPIHSMPKCDLSAGAKQEFAGNGFPLWLKQIMERSRNTH
jgi:flagellar protein FliO/FliZ